MSEEATRPSTSSERLKTQGNAFHVAGKYKAAYAKYTEAIALDPANAILWANRAASSLAMKEYLDAVTDAEMATKLDPNYAKAWARRATAEHSLSSYKSSISSWESALECLPPEEKLSETQRALKVDFIAGLNRAKDAESRPVQSPVVLSKDSAHIQNLPWKRALAMEQQLVAEQKMSSAWVILNAYKEFNEGMEKIRTVKYTQIGDQLRMQGQHGGIADITNGILRDTRVFHVNDMPDFFERYSYQIQGETAMFGAWAHAGPKLVQKEALERLKTSGWESVRQALSTTIRGWIMRGFMDDNIREGSFEFYRNAVEVLEWGSRVWDGVPKDDRGAIFQPTFIRGVKRLYLISLSRVYTAKGSECGYSLNEIAGLALALIADVQAHPATPGEDIDFGFWVSFWLYPKAHALSILGWCSMRSAFEADSDETSIRCFAESAASYTKAAETFLKDDENYAYFLKIALEAHWWGGSPLRLTLPLAKKIREALPDIKKIWEYSLSSEKHAADMEQVLSFETEMKKRLEEGSMTLDSSAGPAGMGPERLRERKEMLRGSRY